MSTDHIEARGRTMYCTRCECASEVKMPAKIDDIIAQMDSFRDAHKNCPPRTIEAEMSEYIKGFEAGCEHLIREVRLYYRSSPMQADAIITHLRKGLK